MVLDGTMTSDEARALLQERALRATAPRIAVLCVLADAQNPLSHTEVLERLGQTDWDPATISRNLVKLREAKIIEVVSRANGIDRYARGHDGDEAHHHPHFVCNDCGGVTCLPIDVVPVATDNGRWSSSVKSARIQLRGECPDCLTLD